LFVAATSLTSTRRVAVPPTQQLRLHRERHLRDLVEKERAPVSLLEEPLAVLGGARERSAPVPEQLALEQGLGECGRVHCAPRAARARAAVVNGAADQVLAGARLTQHENRAARRGEARDQLEHAPNGRALADDRRKRARLRRRDVASQAGPRTREQLVGHALRHDIVDHVGDACAVDRFERERRAIAARDERAGDGRPRPAHSLEQLDAAADVDALVDDDQIEAGRLEAAQRLRPGLDLGHAREAPRESARKDLAAGRVVADHECPAFRRSRGTHPSSRHFVSSRSAPAIRRRFDSKRSPQTGSGRRFHSLRRRLVRPSSEAWRPARSVELPNSSSENVRVSRTLGVASRDARKIQPTRAGARSACPARA
jgi:hypothetical protein